MIFKKQLICLAVGFSLATLFTGKSFAADEIYIPLVSKGFQHHDSGHSGIHNQQSLPIVHSVMEQSHNWQSLLH